MADIIHTRLHKRRPKPFILSTSVQDLKKELGGVLPDNEVFKIIGLNGSIASLSFIKLVADYDIIEELTASTLRIGQKQFCYLENMAISNRLKKARFFTSKMMTEVDGKRDKYNYAKRFVKICKKNNWDHYVVNNHSKIILMRTKNAYFVLETNSNLNENPKIEQYSFENNKELYDFYYAFFDELERMSHE